MGQTPVNEAFVGTKEAADILGVVKSNVAKMLKRNGIEFQIVKVGPTRKDTRIYLRAEVEALRDRRAADTAAREADEKRRLTASAEAASA